MAVNGTTAPIKAIEEAKIDILSQTQEDVSQAQLRCMNLSFTLGGTTGQPQVEETSRAELHL